MRRKRKDAWRTTEYTKEYDRDRQRVNYQARRVMPCRSPCLEWFAEHVILQGEGGEGSCSCTSSGHRAAVRSAPAGEVWRMPPNALAQKSVA